MIVHFLVYLPGTRFELVTRGFSIHCSAPELSRRNHTSLLPDSNRWPLHYKCNALPTELKRQMYAALRYTFGSSWIRTSEGINQRIYNPPPLTTRTPTPKAYIATLSEWQDSNLRPHLPKRRALPNCATLRNHTCIWDGRIRTFDTRNQKPTPCHLATPHTQYNAYFCTFCIV